MTLMSSPPFRTHNSDGSDHIITLAKPRRARNSVDSTISSASGNDGSSSSSVLRVSMEVENIGERVAISKKRVTWRFVLAESEKVHTLMLEHSRISAKKRLNLDGQRLFTSEQYATYWHYNFHVGVDPSTPFRVIIQDLKTSFRDQGRLETIYDLIADGVHWDQLAERFLPVAIRHHSASVWNSDMYVRRVEETFGELLSDGGECPPGTLVTWTFAFGLNGTVHKLELRDLEKGEFVVVLDCRELKRVNFDDIQGDMWEFEYDMEDQHELDLVVTLVDEHKTYDFFVDGSAWSNISQTNFVLESGWYPVFSRSRNAVYFRHDGTGNTQWEKPIVDRESLLTNRPLQEFDPVSLDAQGLDDLVHGMHTVCMANRTYDEPESECDQGDQLVSMKEPLHPVLETLGGPESHEADLIDFSDAVTPMKMLANGEYKGCGPYDLMMHTNVVDKEKKDEQSQQPVDFLSI